MPIQVSDIINEIIVTEGGFTNNPKDAAHYGKANSKKGQKYDCYCTKFGITQNTYSFWLGRQASIEEIRTMDKATAYHIYETEYFLEPRFDKLPEGIVAQVVDIGVNSGPKSAIKMLQRVVNRLSDTDVEVDGVLGPQTISITFELDQLDLNNSLVDERINFFDRLVSIRPENQEFINGWKKRAEKFRRT